MRLSVIMPVHNRETYVRAALRSLLRQRDAADLDIIVIDDGSTDGSAQAVRAMMEEAPCIRLFQQENMGVTIEPEDAGLGGQTFTGSIPLDDIGIFFKTISRTFDVEIEKTGPKSYRISKHN